MADRLVNLPDGTIYRETGERLVNVGGVVYRETISTAPTGFKPYFVQDSEVISGMKKNVAGQTISAQMITISDGSDFTGTVTVTVTKDGGTQTAGGGTVTHEGGGEHSYAPTQAETDADFIAFKFSGTGAITNGKELFTDFPQTVDNDTKISLIPTTAMRGTDNAATASALSTVDTNVDSILVDTGTTIPAQITALNDFDPATDAVANVTLVATTTTNTDQRGTDSALLAASINLTGGAVDNVTTVATTTTNTDMRGTDSALLAADINLTGGAVDNVTLVATTTTNTDMRGTDSAATATSLATVDTNVDAILVDTSTTIPAQITALNDITAADVLAAGDADGFSLEEALKLLLSASTGILSGAATSTIIIKAADGSKTRLTATVDVDGNRSAVVKDVTG